MTQETVQPATFERRRDWTREEWIVAFDACPKDKQRYSATSRDVLEVAYLIDRTPAAVSRSFANIWSAMTEGRGGLANNSELCRQVVSEYLDNLESLHSAALVARSRYLQGTLAPRLEIRSGGKAALLDDDLRKLAYQASRETGVPRRGFVIYRRAGSLVEGAVLIPFTALATALAERFVRWVEGRLKRASAESEVEVLRTRTWVDLCQRKRVELEERVILRYLPSANVGKLSAAAKRALARYLAPLLGVTRGPRLSAAGRPKAPTAERIREIESVVGDSVRGLSRLALTELDQLVRVANTAGLRKAARKLQQMKLDDYEDGKE